jgi:hypothetical protein
MEIENVQGVDDTRDVTQDGQDDVDEEVGAAAALEEDTDGWEEDGEDDLDDVAVERECQLRLVSSSGRESRALPCWRCGRLTFR